ncbi:MAG TPA: division/cell wall cluster transcriptional repressor MraZ [Candidatus Brocadiaceae bacterium]|nr:division/cell wall cluster transcriptional repressor MraZ [Candidatus Brocadiaceae bacterium]
MDFNGKYRHSIDDKNRLAIPSKILETIDKEKEGNGFVITQGFDDCLFLYTTRKWKEVESELRKIDIKNEKDRHYQRVTIASMVVIPECDQQGRIVIPPEMKEFAKLEKKVVIIGILDRIEIWNEKLWEKYSTGGKYKGNG